MRNQLAISISLRTRFFANDATNTITNGKRDTNDRKWIYIHII